MHYHFNFSLHFIGTYFAIPILGCPTSLNLTLKDDHRSVLFETFSPCFPHINDFHHSLHVFHTSMIFIGNRFTHRTRNDLQS